jgi:ribosome biogenesis GTP-binding protein YsxC/EngB
MNYNKAEFITSVYDLEKQPEIMLPEIVFAGRSNVGKSSMINKLVNRKNFARISSVPGKTACINYYSIDNKAYFTDLPGYGYAKVAKTEKQRWSSLIDGYFLSNRDIRLVILLIDIRHKPSDDDKMMYRFLMQSGFPFMIVPTKSDKLSKLQIENRIKEIRMELSLPKTVQLIPFSSENGNGSGRRNKIMKYIRFQKENQIYYGVLTNNKINVITKDYFSDYEITHQCFDIKDVKILAPSTPSKIVCVGLNYLDHAKEMKLEVPKNPIIFIKPSTAVINPNENIVIPKQSERVDYECELAFVIKKKAKNVKAENFKDYILGYTCLNDVTARDLQNKDGQWTRAKSFDTFAPFGPIISDEVDPSQLAIKSILNGKVVQSSNTEQFIFKIPELLEFITEIMTLNAGDVVSTGTPSGIGKMNSGDKIEINIEGIGSLVNTVI